MKVVLLGAAVFAVIVSAWLLAWSPEARTKDTYSEAVLGQSESEILAKLGEPHEVEACGEFLWWNGDQQNPPKNDGRCVKWVRYNFFLNAYAFGYSKDGKLVSRYHYVSE